MCGRIFWKFLKPLKENQTADLLGEMHLAGVTAKQLAAEVGWNPKYLSVVLNGHKEPKGAEEKLNAALGRLVSGQIQDTTEQVQ